MSDARPTPSAIPGPARSVEGTQCPGPPTALDYVEIVARIHETYRHLVMDTDEEQAVHARLIANADQALALARRELGG